MRHLSPTFSQEAPCMNGEKTTDSKPVKEGSTINQADTIVAPLFDPAPSRFTFGRVNTLNTDVKMKIEKPDM